MNKNKTFTIATFSSIIGLAILGVGTYLGHSFLSGGEMSNDILYAVGTVAISAILLSTIIKARKAENDLDKWKTFEYLILVIYLGFAVIAGYMGGTGHLVEVLTHKKELRQMAENDIDGIYSMLDEYEEDEEYAINSTCMGLKNSISYGSRRASDLEDFFEETGIPKTDHGIESYKDFLHEELLGDTFEEISDYGTAALDSIQQAIDSWNLLRLPSQAKRLESVATEISSKLDELREEYVFRLPTIEPTSDGYDITDYPTLDYDYSASGLSFYNAISKNEKPGAIAWVVIAVINFFILLPYLTTRRTTVLRTKGTEDDGGIIIKRN